MYLALDIGNTNIVLGAFENDELRFSTRIATDKKLEADQYALQLKGILNLHGAQQCKIKGAIVSSVVPQITQALVNALITLLGIEPLLFNNSNCDKIKVKIDNPNELGADLIAGALGAKCKYSLPAIIVDLGTATKITAVSEKGEILGCSIMPGVFISLNALTGAASALSGIAINAPENQKAIGTNTQNSMKSGVVYGTACMIDGMVERFNEEMRANALVIATGGAASLIAPHCKTKITLEPNLILNGLYCALKKEIQNAKNNEK